MGVKICRLELENVKRVRALALEPGADGLTVIGGNNGQGKTSVLDAICFALGGEKYRPSDLQRTDSNAPAAIKLTLSNGLVVERKGKNAALTVSDPSGAKAGQKLLDSFVEQFALDLPKFMDARPKEKAESLLKVIGIGEVLDNLDRKEKLLYDERTTIGRIADSKKKHVEEMPAYDGVPELPLTAAELVAESQEIMRRNAERENARRNVVKLEADANRAAKTADRKMERVNELREMVERAEAEYAAAEAEQENARDVAERAMMEEIPADESTEEVESRLAEIEEVNAKVRANLDRAKAEADAKAAAVEYEGLSKGIEEVRQSRADLLAGANLPLPELGIADGELTYGGRKWDCMSGAERLRASAAIVQAVRPECGFLLMDKLEQFDRATLAEFGAWAEAAGMQIIATRVGDGEQCQIIIEDGRAVQGGADAAEKFSAGEF